MTSSIAVLDREQLALSTPRLAAAVVTLAQQAKDDIETLQTTQAGESSFTAGGDLTGDATTQTVVKVHGATAPIAGGLTTGNVLKVSGASALSYGAVNLAGGSDHVTGTLPTGNQAAQILAGDLSGTTAAATVAKANGATVPSAGSLTTGTVLRVTGASALGYGAVDLANASAVTGTLPTANQVSQALAGDVTGTTAAATVAKINGSTVPVGGSLTTGTVLRATGASALAYGAVDLANASAVTGTLPAGNQASQTISGDVTGTTAASVVAKANGATVPSAGSLTTGNVLQVSGASALTYGALNLAGGAGYVTGALPNANQAAQTLTGDVSGTTAASQVDKLGGAVFAIGTTFQSWGTNPATTGVFRGPNAASPILATRNTGNTANMVGIDTDTTGIYFGTSAALATQYTTARIYAFSSVVIGLGSTNYFSATSSRCGLIQSTGGISTAFKWGRTAKTWPSDANYTLSATEYQNPIIEVSGGLLSATRNLVFPLTSSDGAWFIVFNNTSGAVIGQAIQCIGASGTGVTIANGMRATIYTDGTNYYRVTPDT